MPRRGLEAVALQLTFSLSNCVLDMIGLEEIIFIFIFRVAWILFNFALCMWYRNGCDMQKLISCYP